MHSMMTCGICSQPVRIISDSASMVIVEDLRDGDQKRRKKASIKYVCSSVGEGQLMFKASMDLVASEQAIAQQEGKARARRKEDAIARLCGIAP